MNNQSKPTNNSIYLRQVNPKDANLLWEKAYQNHDFMHDFRAHDKPEDLTALRMRIVRSLQVPFVSNGYCEYVIEHVVNGPIGIAVLANYCPHKKSTEFLIGLWDQKANANKGLESFGLQAYMLLMEYCFKELEINNVYAYVYADNTKPQNNLLKMGLKQTQIINSDRALIKLEISRDGFITNQRLRRFSNKLLGRNVADLNKIINKNSTATHSAKKQTQSHSQIFLSLISPNLGKKNLRRNALVTAITVSLPMVSQAANFDVTAATDDGTGLVNNTLSKAILDANTAAGDDTITIKTDVVITGVMKRLIDSNIIIQSDNTRRTIDGDRLFRPLFIKSGNVTIQDIDLIKGRAQGGSANKSYSGTGAGLGGSLFIYAGDVQIKDVLIDDSQAFGGTDGGNYGGAGMFGSALATGGGGLFASSSTGMGAYGGYGNYQSPDTNFGVGTNDNTYSTAGFGAGGGWSNIVTGSHGGFGGGGGKSTSGQGGNGGFGGGRGSNFNGSNGTSGYGGSTQYGAGMGGGIFIRSGTVNLTNVTLSNNSASASGGASGLGGALFILHDVNNSNGNNQGMPASLATVSGCGNTFNTNTALTSNDDIFDTGNTISSGSLTSLCAEINVTGNSVSIVDGDSTPSMNDDSDFASTPVTGGLVAHTFTIENTGAANLNLTGNPNVEISGTDANEFSVTTQPAVMTINGGASTTFVVTFDPSSSGLKFATISIDNDDADENPYDFAIQGLGLSTLTVSSIIADVNEGESLVFSAQLDVVTGYDVLVDYDITGDVDLNDFDPGSLTGQVTLLANTNNIDITLLTSQDGITEGIENLDVTINTHTANINLGSSLNAMGTIDDDLIFISDFEQIPPALLLASIPDAKDGETQRPYFDEHTQSIYFFNAEFNLNTEDNPMQWLQDVLAISRPYGDWDNDGIINQDDGEPFGLK